VAFLEELVRNAHIFLTTLEPKLDLAVCTPSEQHQIFENQTHAMERTQEAGEILVNSLLLLGTSLNQSSREYGCEIRQDMFLQPNQKGLNTLFHLLLDRLRGREFIKKVRLLLLLDVFTGIA
jgi:hypothetical protein